MRTDVLDELRRIEVMRLRVRQADKAMAALDATGQLILDILMDNGCEKMVRIANELGVSQATAYRYVSGLLEEIANLLL